jgi:D-sedoheptulose 7-phosphate isomerase
MKQTTTALLDEALVRHPLLVSCREAMLEAATALLQSHAGGGKVLVCGNGGSAADAEHLVGELMNKYLIRRTIPADHASALGKAAGADGKYLAANLQQAVPAVSLVSQSSLITSVSNDVAADVVFAQQVYAYGRPEDVLIAISTSGNARNVVLALHAARLVGAATIGLSGRSGGAMKALCDTAVCVPADRTPEVQELHLPVYHTLCGMVENEVFGA